MARDPYEPWWVLPFAVTILVALAIASAGVGAMYGHFMYGDWRCGMPGVQCRRTVP